MIMKNKMIVLLIVLLNCILLCSCESAQQKELKKITADESDDFVTYEGASMAAAPDGYYIMQGGFLYFVSSDFSQSTIVCDKLACVHNDSGVNNLNDYYECNAYFGTGTPIINYSGDFLYISGTDPNSHGEIIQKVSTDGSEKTVCYKTAGDICGFCIYGGKAYIGEESYTADNKIQKIVSFPLDNPDEVEEIYETEEYPSSTMNRMKCKNGYCYFYLFNPEDLENESVYISIDLNTKEAELLYKPSPCWIEAGQKRSIMQVREYQSIEPLIWTEEYYSIPTEDGELHIPSDTEKMQQLTKDDFASIGNHELLRNMDEDYVYFISVNYGDQAVPQEDQKIHVYSQDGQMAAEISAAELGELYYILPGNEDYMFIQVVPIMDGVYNPANIFYYVDKSEFNGGTVEAHRIDISS